MYYHSARGNFFSLTSIALQQTPWVYLDLHHHFSGTDPSNLALAQPAQERCLDLGQMLGPSSASISPAAHLQSHPYPHPKTSPSKLLHIPRLAYLSYHYLPIPQFPCQCGEVSTCSCISLSPLKFFKASSQLLIHQTSEWDLPHLRAVWIVLPVAHSTKDFFIMIIFTL